MSWYNPNDATTVAPEGWYRATIKSTEMKHTKNGDPMQVVQFRVDTPRRQMVISDYFHPANVWKYKKLAASLGQEEQFMAGEFNAADYINKPVELELVVEDNDQYGEQNKITKFASLGTNGVGEPASSNQQTQPVQSQQPAVAISHDDIPF